MLKIEELEPVYNQIEKLFDLIKRQLFIDEWLRKKTSLVFAFVNTTEKPDKMYFHERNGERYDLDIFDVDENEQYTNTIKKRLAGWHVNGESLMQKLRLSEVKECKVRIWCICCCPCLNDNKGKWLLQCTFENLMEALKGWCIVLERKNPKSGKRLQMETIENTHEIVEQILETAAHKVCTQLEGLYFPVKMSYINSLSGEYYEREECQSNLIFLPRMRKKDIDASKFVYDFSKAGTSKSILFIPENIRWIRKLLQMAQKELYLVLQVSRTETVYEVLGICEENKITQLLKNKYVGTPFFRAKVKKHMQWDLFLGDTYIFSFRNGKYKITQQMPEEYLKEMCEAVFGGEEKDYDYVIQSITNSENQSHGTMLVVLSEKDAKCEVKRLSSVKAGMSAAKPKVSAEMINCLNAIDGSVMMDTSGKVHGIGMILDGDSIVEGNPARGARYNSALKYQKLLKNHNMRGLILIVSEDGSVEILQA